MLEDFSSKAYKIVSSALGIKQIIKRIYSVNINTKIIVCNKTKKTTLGFDFTTSLIY